MNIKAVWRGVAGIFWIIPFAGWGDWYPYL